MQSLAAVHPFFEFEVDILTLQRLIGNAVADFGCLQVFFFDLAQVPVLVALRGCFQPMPYRLGRSCC